MASFLVCMQHLGTQPTLHQPSHQVGMDTAGSSAAGQSIVESKVG